MSKYLSAVIAINLMFAGNALAVKQNFIKRICGKLSGVEQNAEAERKKPKSVKHAKIHIFKSTKEGVKAIEKSKLPFAVLLYGTNTAKEREKSSKIGRILGEVADYFKDKVNIGTANYYDDSKNFPFRPHSLPTLLLFSTEGYLIGNNTNPGTTSSKIQKWITKNLK
jgi:hypothetical protein